MASCCVLKIGTLEISITKISSCKTTKKAYISAKTGTLVFAVINTVAATLFSAFSIGTFIYLATTFLVADNDDGPLTIALNDIVREMFICIPVIALAILCLVFSSFLLNGILKKKAEHIKVYFVYGTVKIFLATFILFSSYYCPAFENYYETRQLQTVAALLSLFSYSLILYMIRITYKNIEADKIQFEHKPLVEKS